MADYGHDLLLGSFVTPTNKDPQRPVRLAVASEHAGLDLVTFQDHPYQPGFHDTWTLIAYAAARTERITLAGNVLNLPLRPAATLARSVASLDLLTGGRVALGLGAGAFWDAIEAMGGTRLTPGQAVTALDEAIDVIRGVWDTDTPGVLRAGGEHHRVDGAKRGPSPAHPVDVWLGAYKPRMLALTGAKADGWLPSLAYMSSHEDLAAANARIDDAAHEAGRDPRQVRRLLNISGTVTDGADDGFLQGPVQQWVEQLAGLTLEQGFSGYVLMGDDERTLQVLGQEIGPELRDLVARERGTGSAR
ncbi:LLM class flavin-dependent oxidoreductase [Cellulomonas bogoriensis]|uniref:5,10-methylene tetrahydromethanopterin reductase n=1 Tax=Cellulomonas bogoriensis 69B4 = DSM 16987 TaxID=1386082 RepID=A0A0A0BXN2_9CELL|nr:5,10-methylene tetrahydromethanopterin reductase [Cellulomonas bogoriensis 69B4 = DSM 16987]